MSLPAPPEKRFKFSGKQHGKSLNITTRVHGAHGHTHHYNCYTGFLHVARPFPKIPSMMLIILSSVCFVNKEREVFTLPFCNSVRFLKQAGDYTVFIYINPLCRRGFWQPRHGHDVSRKHNQEAGSS
jgi:hypothetical protein